MKKIYIYKNETKLSNEAYEKFCAVLLDHDFEIMDRYQPDADLIACIGGDGTFLHFIHQCDFPSCPIIGINTGHLGFFQELMPDDVERFLPLYESGTYSLQEIRPIEAEIYTEGGVTRCLGLNEIMVRGPYTHITHMEVRVDQTWIQNFSGDGILISTPVGSTAYNYSLGGSIVSPELDVLQMTPIAPSNTNAYRCFYTSVMYPASRVVTILPIGRTRDDRLLISYDGLEILQEKVECVKVRQSDKTIRLIRFDGYDYWQKLSAKLL
ncbi:MAG: NAD(+)/NADH kinase [Mogibacterium sp.]|nr:NAD(+)/NADH kinase [Mogibacterium sp.]